MSNLMISDYAMKQQSNAAAEALATILRDNGSMRLYGGEQRPLSQRTDGRIVECKLTSVTVDGGVITVEWAASKALKDAVVTLRRDERVTYYRLCSGNVPVMSGSVGMTAAEFNMVINNTEIKDGMDIKAGKLIHSVRA